MEPIFFLRVAGDYCDFFLFRSGRGLLGKLGAGLAEVWEASNWLVTKDAPVIDDKTKRRRDKESIAGSPSGRARTLRLKVRAGVP